MQIKKGQRRKLSLTTLLIGLVSLAVLLTSSILLIASYESKRESLIDTTLHLNYSNANKMSQTIDSLFRSMRASLMSSAEFFAEKSSMTQDERNNALEMIRNSSNYFNSMLIIDENGKLQNVDPGNLVTVGVSINEITGLEVNMFKEPFLSEPFIASTGRLIVYMSQPILDKSGNYLGAIGGTIYLHDRNILTMIFGSDTRDELGSYYYVVGSNGNLIFHPDSSRIGEDVNSNSVVQKLVMGKSGEETVINTRGEKMLAGYSSVPTSGWGVVMVSPVSVMQQQLKMHIKSILWFMLIPFVILLLGVILIARELARPFADLANLVSRIDKEDIVLHEKKPHWNREADLLTSTVLMAIADFQKHADLLTQEAQTDSLTGLSNRRNLENTMNQWIDDGYCFSLIVMDVDKFKVLNDTYGHLSGDDVLRHVARVITASVRPGDMCCRYGGEEFVILLANTTAMEAYRVAERIRKKVSIEEMEDLMQVTVSQGIAQFPVHAETSESLFQLADQALYHAKETGRNRTVVASLRNER
ncbi:diguanylate cyclase [Paenibacillus sp. sgz500958]|uniref:sensor domain-containing diguanylate cyclase n=1 Tax=Paenibacillus sp. sgz500958 TaxID=3242475 RepID=UPI0036D37865